MYVHSRYECALHHLLIWSLTLKFTEEYKFHESVESQCMCSLLREPASLGSPAPLVALHHQGRTILQLWVCGDQQGTAEVYRCTIRSIWSWHAPRAKTCFFGFLLRCDQWPLLGPMFSILGISGWGGPPHEGVAQHLRHERADTGSRSQVAQGVLRTSAG